MKSIYLIKLLILIIAFFGAEKIHACTCIGDISVKNEIKRSDVVFLGEVVKIDIVTVNLLDTNFNIDIDLHILKIQMLIYFIFKGQLKSDTITVYTGMGEGDCGYNFELGKKYIVYADYETRFFNFCDKVPKFLSTNICKRTCELNSTELEELSKYRKPTRPTFAVRSVPEK